MTGRKLLLTFLFGLVVGQSAISALEPGNAPQVNDDYDGDYYDDEYIDMYHEKAELKAVTVAKEGVQIQIPVNMTTVSPPVAGIVNVNINISTANAVANDDEKIIEGTKNKEDEPEATKDKPETSKEDFEEQAIFPDLHSDEDLDSKSNPNPNESGPVISLAGDEMEKTYDSNYYDDVIEQNVFVEKIYPNNDRQTVDVNLDAQSELDTDNDKDKSNDSVFGHRFIFTTARTDTIFSGIFIGFLALTLATVLFAFYRGLVWFNQRTKTEIVYERMEQGGDIAFRQ